MTYLNNRKYANVWDGDAFGDFYFFGIGNFDVYFPVTGLSKQAR